MLKIGITELLIRTLPESFLFILIIQSYSGEKISKKTYISSSLILTFAVYFIRALPIHYGVHNVINIIILILIIAYINKIKINKAISYSLILSILLSFSETLNLIIMEQFLNVDTKTIFVSPIKKCMFFSPSLITIFIVYIIFLRINNRRIKDVFC